MTVPADTAPTEAAPATEQPPAAPEAPPQPLDRAAARQGAVEDARRFGQQLETTEEETAEETTPPEAGETPPEETPPAEEPKAEGGGAESEEAPAPETPAEESEKPEAEGVVVNIHPRHPAANGLDKITVGSEQEARVVRAALKGFTRGNEVNNIREKHDAVLAKNRELTETIARRDAADAAREKFQQDPRYPVAAKRYQELAQAERDGGVSEGTAQEYWQNFWLGARDLEEQEFKTRMDAHAQTEQEAAAADLEAQGKQWLDDAWERTDYFPDTVRGDPEFKTIFDANWRSFHRDLGAGEFDEVLARLPQAQQAETLHQEFSERLQSRLVRHTRLREAYQRGRQDPKDPQTPPPATPAEAPSSRKEIERQAVEKYKRDEATKRASTPPNPMGAIASAATSTPAPSESDGDKPTEPESVHEIRKRARAGAREDARKYVTQ